MGDLDNHMKNKENYKLSFVIPCYRSENTIGIVIDEIESTVAKRPEYDYEIILINDCSPDNVWKVISELSNKNDHIIGINLSKNFGQHAALLAGYNHCSGDIVVSLDDDGQTPACDVFKLIDKLDEGYDMVNASYPQQKQKLYRRLGSDLARKMSNYMFDIKDDSKDNGSSFFVAKRFIIDEIIRYKNPYPYMGGLLLRTTRNIGHVLVEHRSRIEGKSGYSFKSLVSLWMNGFTAFSVKPLQLGTYVGFFASLCGILFAIITVVRKLWINPNLEAGWSSTISVILFVGGIIMMMLGLIGEYVGRIYICINNSPQYVIKEMTGYKKVEDKDE